MSSNKRKYADDPVPDTVEKKAKQLAVPIDRNVLTNRVLTFGTAGACSQTLSWKSGVEFNRSIIQAQAKRFEDYLKDVSPTLLINVVGMDGICGSATITLLFAPSAVAVFDAFGADLAAHKAAVAVLLDTYKDKFEEMNIPLGSARTEPGGTYVVCDEERSALFLAMAEIRGHVQRS